MDWLSSPRPGPRRAGLTTQHQTASGEMPSELPTQRRNRRVRLRRLRPEDRPLLQEFLAQIDSYDLQMRFFAALRSVPPALLDFLMHVDCEQRMVLVAIDDRSHGQAPILALAHAHAHPRGETAEIALLVRSDLKGIGFGSLLLDRLIRDCRNHGVARLEADVLRQNARMLRLARKYGFRKHAAEGGTVRLALELTSAAA